MPLTRPNFPIYLPTKGRFRYMVTSKALTAMGVPHYLIVEPQEIDAYREAVRDMNLTATVLELDMSLKAKYELCDDLGLSKSTGSGPARNFAGEHSRAAGEPWHWVVDDNIKAFYRLNKNLKVRVSDGTIFRCMEDFCTRYRNVAMAGPNYFMFASRKSKIPPFTLNTRIYSCNLIRNNVPLRWRGRYNEDTILSLDMLKAGWCTVLFNAFLQEKMQTQSLPGGNTDELYSGKDRKAGEKYSAKGTIPKSEMLVRVHPDVARIAFRFKRWHHFVDYTPFKANRLVYRDDVSIPEGVDNYGMSLRKIA